MRATLPSPLAPAREAAQTGNVGHGSNPADRAPWRAPGPWWSGGERARWSRFAASEHAPNEPRLEYYRCPAEGFDAASDAIVGEWDRERVAVHPMTPDDVVALPRFQLAARVPSLFHQGSLHALACAGADASTLQRRVERYFRALRLYKEFGGRILWSLTTPLDETHTVHQRRLLRRCLEETLALADLIHVSDADALERLRTSAGREIGIEMLLLPEPRADPLLEVSPTCPPELARLVERDHRRLWLLMAGAADASALTDAVTACKDLPVGAGPGPTLVVLGALPHETVVGNPVRIERTLSDAEFAFACRQCELVIAPTPARDALRAAAAFSLPLALPRSSALASRLVDGQTGLLYQPPELRDRLSDAIRLSPLHLERIGREGAGVLQAALAADYSRELLAAAWRLAAPHPSAREVALPLLADTGKLLSFCIPVMNRLGDLQATLRQNLDDNREDSGVIEFIVVCFDDNDAVERWLSADFPADLASGYLRFERSNALESWHFGKAKNAFVELLKGRIYASLDGDNFTGRRGGRHIIDLFTKFHFDCILHQFQGTWGDGTCGRIALTREDYRNIGYDARFLPRQWDELDAILSVLVARPTRRYLCYRGRSVLEKSPSLRRFLQENRIEPQVVELDPDSDPARSCADMAALGQHDSDYVAQSDALKLASRFNHLSSFVKNCNDDARRQLYAKELLMAQRRLLDTLDPVMLERWFLEPADSDRAPIQGKITLLAVVADEPALPGWYRYYRDLGVERFFIVDDHSRVPVEQVLPYDDVHVWRPAAGHFRYAKVLWLGVLLRRYCQGAWCLTVDGDEYLELPRLPRTLNPDRVSPIEHLIRDLDSRKLDYACGVLVDLVPDAEAVRDLLNGREVGLERYHRFQWWARSAPTDYCSAHKVQWSVGERGSWAFRFDVRYRVNGSLDAQRKFPLFRFVPGLHLNQGFHDLVLGGIKREPCEIERRDLLPIRHFKLWSMAEQGRTNRVRDAAAYHGRTGRNLQRFHRNLMSSLLRASSAPFLFPFFGYAALPLASQARLVVVSAGSRRVGFRELLMREVGLVYEQTSGPVRLMGNSILAPSKIAARDWLRSNTPFRSLIDETAEGFVLECPHL